ncbi:hypothetical protein O181_026589 [Austropuccinia psidii MF-1]|uniref:Uncharacterized protein n=1 Tax=Austropuccinia psidii MF-1 TaxID=1389203 RepID=A0A9Q3CMK3_9BASI|nr:hypothetical protein [Austropuccinia psidii MF-1]
MAWNTAYPSDRSPAGLQQKPALHHREITITARKGMEPPIPYESPKRNLLTSHPTSWDFHDMWKRACVTDARSISERK